MEAGSEALFWVQNNVELVPVLSQVYRDIL